MDQRATEGSRQYGGDLVRGAERHANGAKGRLKPRTGAGEGVETGGKYEGAIARAAPRQDGLRHGLGGPILRDKAPIRRVQAGIDEPRRQTFAFGHHQHPLRDAEAGAQYV